MRKLIARAFLWLTGWKPEGARPEPRRYVLIAAPHTSNWDLAYLLALSEVFDVRVSWMGKDSLFRPPLGWVMRRLGGIPVVRHKRGNLVAAVAADLRRARGPRARRPRRGHARLRAPLEVGLLPHRARRRRCRSCSATSTTRASAAASARRSQPTGDVRRDMDEIRDFYADKVGKYPDQFGEVRLKEEG